MLAIILRSIKLREEAIPCYYHLALFCKKFLELSSFGLSYFACLFVFEKMCACLMDDKD
jgi:hypothetical protein